MRIPNESLLKAEVTNLTHFPIRRYDMALSIAYKEDIARVRDILFDLAVAHPLCLVEPTPLLIVRGFGESSVELTFAIWAVREDFLDMKNGMHEVIKQAFDAEGIEIPYPHRALLLSSRQDAVPVRMAK